jgi:holo-[acyl-carrier protein] synthase
MIIGIGVDLVDMRRIDRLIKQYGARFINKVFTPSEQDYAEKNTSSVRAYANRFAAKEAAAKALGTGMAGGISWQDIEVLRAPSGAPSLCFHGKALEHLASCLPSGYISHSYVSFSDEPPYSTAFVVISAALPPKE